MEVMVKKFQSKFRKVREEMNRWGELQSCLISQFRNASHILDRLKVLQISNNYGILSCVSGVRDALLEKQIGSLNNILVSMRRTLFPAKLSLSRNSWCTTRYWKWSYSISYHSLATLVILVHYNNSWMMNLISLKKFNFCWIQYLLKNCVDVLFCAILGNA